MSQESLIVSPGPDARSVRSAKGEVLRVPDGWELLPPGDAGLTRRVKAGGPTWTVQERRGRKVFSRGVWAPADVIAAARAALDAERATPAYARKRAANTRRRERVQDEYVEEFGRAVLEFLAFDARHRTIAESLARAVTEHATPVGSGTVARAQRIPVERRAEAAVIAWMRHQTTAYEHMTIPRIRGKRREVRRLLAQRSRELLDAYRKGHAVDAAACPLQKALSAGAVRGTIY
jgi:hypothetical protein